MTLTKLMPCCELFFHRVSQMITHFLPLLTLRLSTYWLYSNNNSSHWIWCQMRLVRTYASNNSVDFSEFLALLNSITVFNNSNSSVTVHYWWLLMFADCVIHISFKPAVIKQLHQDTHTCSVVYWLNLDAEIKHLICIQCMDAQTQTTHNHMYIYFAGPINWWLLMPILNDQNSSPCDRQTQAQPLQCSNDYSVNKITLKHFIR